MIRISLDNQEIFNITCDILLQGGIIIYPTDTLYGLGGDATNGDTVKKINKIKRRISPLSVLAPDINTALSWMNLKKDGKIQVSKILGGKTTVIVPVFRDIVHSLVIGNNNTLGIRIPDHPFCQKISQKFEAPIITTSVNRTGNLPMTEPQKIHSEFINEVDLLIDGGNLFGSGSTIYIYNNSKLNVVRP